MTLTCVINRVIIIIIIIIIIMHKIFGKDRACDSGDILSDRQTEALITVKTRHQ